MARQCFVFVQMPDAAGPVVAGKYVWEDTTDPCVGTFIYGRSYLNNKRAVPLDPVALPLREAEFTTTLTEGFFGVVRDALPDDWGKHVAQRLHGDKANTPFDLLLLPSADRFGALSFGEDATAPIKEPAIPQFEDLDHQVFALLNRIDQDLAITEAERRTAIAFGGGTHAGGARPKLTVQKDGAIWLAKLSRHDDSWNHVRVEAAMLSLARMCGIRVAEHGVEMVGEHELLLIRRFDRSITDGGIRKHRVASAETVFRADETYFKSVYHGSYMRLAMELPKWSNEVESDRHELFRRIAFNCLAGITDDHPRNHALVAEGAHFRLSPAYDLAPGKPGTRFRRQAMSIGDEGDISTRKNLLSSAGKFALSASEANNVIDGVKAGIAAHWLTCFKRYGVSENDIETLRPCFDHAFFESDGKKISQFDAAGPARK